MNLYGGLKCCVINQKLRLYWSFFIPWLHDTSMIHTRLRKTIEGAVSILVKMATHLLFKLSQFRENGDFIDVRLKVDESIFPAHRNVLAANSDYFHAMFTNGMKESNQEVIEFKDESISALSFKIILD